MKNRVVGGELPVLDRLTVRIRDNYSFVYYVSSRYRNVVCGHYFRAISGEFLSTSFK